MSKQEAVKPIDSGQFENYIEEYRKLVYSVCYSFTKNPFDAEDLAQETFLAAYKNFDKFESTNPKSWFCTIAANKCRDFLKSPARKITAVESEDLAYISDSAPATEAELEVRQGDQNVREVCERLKEPYRSVAVAYFCFDETLTEISHKTGDNVKTVATRLYRAKKLLQVIVKEDPAWN